MDIYIPITGRKRQLKGINRSYSRVSCDTYSPTTLRFQILFGAMWPTRWSAVNPTTTRQTNPLYFDFLFKSEQNCEASLLVLSRAVH